MNGSLQGGVARRGTAFVICAPSGTGKTTLVKRLLSEFPVFSFSISCTTRAPRPGERAGVDYDFVSHEEFLRRREAGYFAEWAEVHGNFYGTPLESTRALLAEGRDVLFDVDVQGASQLRLSIAETALVYILPPSREELERRLSGRGTETPESLSRRLAAAGAELAEAPWFDFWVVNDSLDQAWEELKAAYIAATLSPKVRAPLLDQLLKSWGMA